MVEFNKKVSIVIPARNEQAYIGKCIDSFMNQTYPKELFNVIIADGNSTDTTREIIEEYKQKHHNIYVVNNPKITAPTGMNLAINYMDSDIVIIFGAHAHADKDFILENVKALENDEVGCVGGVIKTINDTIKGEAIALAMSCPFGVGNALFRFADKETYVDTVGFGGYRRSLLEEIGIFDEELVRNQDDELNFRVVKSGTKILLTPKIKSKYYSRGSYKKLWKQYFQYGYWKVRVIQKHNRPAALRHLIPMLFVIFLFGGAILSIFSSLARITFLGILALYLLLDIIFSAKLSIRNRLSCFLFILPTFLILYLSYGIGFLLGLLNFCVIKNNEITEKNTRLSR